jgi:hypothetical protein
MLYVAYPNDRPPEVVDLPEDYNFRGHLWHYVAMCQENAMEAILHHVTEWPEHTIDRKLILEAYGRQCVADDAHPIPCCWHSLKRL